MGTSVEIMQEDHLEDAPIITFLVKHKARGAKAQRSMHRVGIPEGSTVKDSHWYLKFERLYEEIFRKGFEAGVKASAKTGAGRA